MPYLRKTEQEIEQVKQAQKRQGLSPMPALWMSLASALLIFLFVSHFPARFSVPLGFSVKSLWVALASGLGIFGFLFALQMFTRHSMSKLPRNQICNACHKPAPSGEQRCPCGGEYEPVDFYRKKDE